MQVIAWPIEEPFLLIESNDAEREPGEQQSHPRRTLVVRSRLLPEEAFEALAKLAALL